MRTVVYIAGLWYVVVVATHAAVLAFPDALKLAFVALYVYFPVLFVQCMQIQHQRWITGLSTVLAMVWCYFTPFLLLEWTNGAVDGVEIAHKLIYAIPALVVNGSIDVKLSRVMVGSALTAIIHLGLIHYFGHLYRPIWLTVAICYCQVCLLAVVSANLQLRDQRTGTSTVKTFLAAGFEGSLLWFFGLFVITSFWTTELKAFVQVLFITSSLMIDLATKAFKASGLIVSGLSLVCFSGTLLVFCAFIGIPQTLSYFSAQQALPSLREYSMFALVNIFNILRIACFDDRVMVSISLFQVISFAIGSIVFGYFLQTNIYGIWCSLAVTQFAKLSLMACLQRGQKHGTEENIGLLAASRQQSTRSLYTQDFRPMPLNEGNDDTTQQKSYKSIALNPEDIDSNVCLLSEASDDHGLRMYAMNSVSPLRLTESKSLSSHTIVSESSTYTSVNLKHECKPSETKDSFRDALTKSAQNQSVENLDMHLEVNHASCTMCGVVCCRRTKKNELEKEPYSAKHLQNDNRTLSIASRSNDQVDITQERYQTKKRHWYDCLCCRCTETSTPRKKRSRHTLQTQSLQDAHHSKTNVLEFEQSPTRDTQAQLFTITETLVKSSSSNMDHVSQTQGAAGTNANDGSMSIDKNSDSRQRSYRDPMSRHDVALTMDGDRSNGCGSSVLCGLCCGSLCSGCCGSNADKRLGSTQRLQSMGSMSNKVVGSEVATSTGQHSKSNGDTFLSAQRSDQKCACLSGLFCGLCCTGETVPELARRNADDATVSGTSNTRMDQGDGSVLTPQHDSATEMDPLLAPPSMQSKNGDDGTTMLTATDGVVYPSKSLAAFASNADADDTLKMYRSFHQNPTQLQSEALLHQQSQEASTRDDNAGCSSCCLLGSCCPTGHKRSSNLAADASLNDTAGSCCGLASLLCCCGSDSSCCRADHEKQASTTGAVQQEDGLVDISSLKNDNGQQSYLSQRSKALRDNSLNGDMDGATKSCASSLLCGLCCNSKCSGCCGSDINDIDCRRRLQTMQSKGALDSDSSNAQMRLSRQQTESSNQRSKCACLSGLFCGLCCAAESGAPLQVDGGTQGSSRIADISGESRTRVGSTLDAARIPSSGSIALNRAASEADRLLPLPTPRSTEESYGATALTVSSGSNLDGSLPVALQNAEARPNMGHDEEDSLLMYSSFGYKPSMSRSLSHQQQAGAGGVVELSAGDKDGSSSCCLWGSCCSRHGGNGSAGIAGDASLNEAGCGLSSLLCCYGNDSSCCCAPRRTDSATLVKSSSSNMDHVSQTQGAAGTNANDGSMSIDKNSDSRQRSYRDPMSRHDVALTMDGDRSNGCGSSVLCGLCCGSLCSGCCGSNADKRLGSTQRLQSRLISSHSVGAKTEAMELECDTGKSDATLLYSGNEANSRATRSGIYSQDAVYENKNFLLLNESSRKSSLLQRFDSGSQKNLSLKNDSNGCLSCFPVSWWCSKTSSQLEFDATTNSYNTRLSSDEVNQGDNALRSHFCGLNSLCCTTKSTSTLHEPTYEQRTNDLHRQISQPLDIQQTGSGGTPFKQADNANIESSIQVQRPRHGSLIRMASKRVQSINSRRHSYDSSFNSHLTRSRRQSSVQSDASGSFKEEHGFHQYSSSADATNTSEAFTKHLINSLDTLQSTQNLENSASWASRSSINPSFTDEASHLTVNRAFSRQSFLESKMSNESIGYGAISTRQYSNSLTDSQSQRFDTEKSNLYIRSLSSLENQNSPRESAATPLLGRSSSSYKSNRLQSTSRSSRLDATIELPKLKKSPSIFSRGLSTLGLIQPAVKPAPVTVGEDDHGPISTSIITEVSVKIDPMYPTDDAVLLKREWCGFFCGMLWFSLRFFAVQLTADIELIFFGHLGTRQLAGAGLARLWIFVMLSFFQYSITAMQPLFRRHGTWLQTALVLCVPATPFLTFYYFHIDYIIQQTMYNPITARFAREYATLVSPGILPLLVLCVLVEYLLAHRILYPVVAFATIACITTIGLHILLVFGYHHWSGFGFAGSPYATIITICVQLLLLYVYAFLIRGYHREKWVSWTRECCRWGRLMTVWTIAAPSGISALLMNLVFAIIGSAASYAPPKKDARRLDDEVDMGSEQAAAWVVSLCFFFLIVSFLRGAAATTSERMEYHLAHKNQKMAKKVLFIGAAYGGISGLLFALLVYYFAAPIFCIWSSDLVLLQMCFSAIRWIAACIAIISVRLVFAAGLTTLGQPHALSVALHIDSWLVQVPLSLILVMLLQWGLEGLWIARLCGEFVHTCFLMYALVVEMSGKEESPEETLPLLDKVEEMVEMPEPSSISETLVTATRDLPKSITAHSMTEEKEESNEDEVEILVKLPSQSPPTQENLHWMRKQSSDGSVKWVAVDEGILSPITEEKSVARDARSKQSSIASTPIASKALASPKHEQSSSDESRSLDLASSITQTPKWVRQQNADGSVQWIAVEPSDDNQSEDLSMDFSTSNSVKSSIDLTSEPHSSANSSIVLQRTPVPDAALSKLSIAMPDHSTSEPPLSVAVEPSSAHLVDDTSVAIALSNLAAMNDPIYLSENKTLPPTTHTPLPSEPKESTFAFDDDGAIEEPTATNEANLEKCPQESLEVSPQSLSTDIGQEIAHSNLLQLASKPSLPGNPDDDTKPEHRLCDLQVVESTQSQSDNHEDRVFECPSEERWAEMPLLQQSRDQDYCSDIDHAAAPEMVDEPHSMACDDLVFDGVFMPENDLVAFNGSANDSAIFDNTSSRNSSIESVGYNDDVPCLYLAEGTPLEKLSGESIVLVNELDKGSDCDDKAPLSRASSSKSLKSVGSAKSVEPTVANVVSNEEITLSNPDIETLPDEMDALDYASECDDKAPLSRVSSSKSFKSVGSSKSANSTMANAVSNEEITMSSPEIESLADEMDANALDKESECHYEATLSRVSSSTSFKSVGSITSVKSTAVDVVGHEGITLSDFESAEADEVQSNRKSSVVEATPSDTLEEKFPTDAHNIYESSESLPVESLEIVIDSMDDKSLAYAPTLPHCQNSSVDDAVEIVIDRFLSPDNDTVAVDQSLPAAELTEVQPNDIDERRAELSEVLELPEVIASELSEIVVVADSTANKTSAVGESVSLGAGSTFEVDDMKTASKKKRRQRNKKKVAEPLLYFSRIDRGDDMMPNSGFAEQFYAPVSTTQFNSVQASPISCTTQQSSKLNEFSDKDASPATRCQNLETAQGDLKAGEKLGASNNETQQHSRSTPGSKSIPKSQANAQMPTSSPEPVMVTQSRPQSWYDEEEAKPPPKLQISTSRSSQDAMEYNAALDPPTYTTSVGQSSLQSDNGSEDTVVHSSSASLTRQSIPTPFIETNNEQFTTPNNVLSQPSDRTNTIATSPIQKPKAPQPAPKDNSTVADLHFGKRSKKLRARQHRKRQHPPQTAAPAPSPPRPQLQPNVKLELLQLCFQIELLKLLQEHNGL